VLAADADEQVPPSTIPTGVERLCAAGSRVELRWVAGAHTATLDDPVSALGAFAWLQARFSGAPTRSDCG
jgi:hypothetical protein